MLNLAIGRGKLDTADSDVYVEGDEWDCDAATFLYINLK